MKHGITILVMTFMAGASLRGEGVPQPSTIYQGTNKVAPPSEYWNRSTGEFVGYRIPEISEKSPLYALGVRAGDVITVIDNRKMSQRSINTLDLKHRPKAVTVLRNASLLVLKRH